MENITYRTEQYYTKHIVRLDDTLFCHPWYMKSFRNGCYGWTRDPLYARPLSEKAAAKHVKNLQAGADDDWKVYHEHWRAYWESVNTKKNA